LPAAEVRVAGKIFQAAERFQAVARDDRNIDTAIVTANGDGRLWIASHGVLYGATWTGSDWQVEELQPGQISVPS
jgi:hypothetical protein